MGRYTGNDNYGRPKSQYLEKLAAMNDEQLGDECYSMIYQSARCANNHKADWHWMVDACFDESEKRGGTIYKCAYKQCFADHAA